MPEVRHRWTWCLALAAVGLALGWAATHLAWIADADLRTLAWIAGNLRSAPATAVMQAVSWLGSTYVAATLILGWCAILACYRRARAAIGVAVIVAAGWGAVALVKLVIARPRPPATEVSALASESTYSYPSGHVAVTFSVAAAAWLLTHGGRWERTAVATGVVMVVVMATSRMYLGVHFPTDVLGAPLISSAAILAVGGVRALRRFHLKPSDPPDRPA